MAQSDEVRAPRGTDAADQDSLIYTDVQNFDMDNAVLIGKGGFGEVLKVRCLVDNHVLALKKIKIFGMMSLKDQTDCVQEIDMLKNLHHPHIIRYYASFVLNNELYIVLELAESGPLSWLIKAFHKSGRKLPEARIWKYFSQICSAIEYMHSRRIMHRDIKPANVFTKKNGDAKVGDLGLGRYVGESTTSIHTEVGTPYYMSPERVQSGGYFYKSDVWSLGCLLYEMAATHHPFYGQDRDWLTLLKAIEEGKYPPLSRDSYSLELRSTVDACMKINADSRPDAAEVSKLAQRMNRLTNQKPQKLRQSSLPEDLHKAGRPRSAESVRSASHRHRKNPQSAEKERRPIQSKSVR